MPQYEKTERMAMSVKMMAAAVTYIGDYDF